MKSLTIEGIDIPVLGLGTWRMAGDACRQSVETALGLGYRHIDTAAVYGNEDAVGAAVAGAGVARDALFITTKAWIDGQSPKGWLRRSLDASLGRLKLDHVDLFLVHWPYPGMNLGEIGAELAALREARLARAVGVSNFTIAMVRELVETVGAPIACNQVEYHAFLDQTALRRYLGSRGIALTAYCPVAQGKAADSPELQEIGRKRGASAAQVALKWLLDQDGVAAVPKAGRLESQKANLEALDLALDDEDRRAIAALPKDRRLVNPGFAPEWDRPE
jgi:2,5-diketo-D-gluconate reductase B